MTIFLTCNLYGVTAVKVQFLMSVLKIEYRKNGKELKNQPFCNMKLDVPAMQ